MTANVNKNFHKQFKNVKFLNYYSLAKFGTLLFQKLQCPTIGFVNAEQLLLIAYSKNVPNFDEIQNYYNNRFSKLLTICLN